MSRSSTRRTPSASLRGTDPDFSGITPQMEAAFDRLDAEMSRAGINTTPSHPFPNNEATGTAGGKGRRKKRRQAETAVHPSPYTDTYSTTVGASSTVGSASSRRKSRNVLTKKRTHDTHMDGTTKPTSTSAPLPRDGRASPLSGRASPLEDPLPRLSPAEKGRLEDTDSALIAVNNGTFTRAAASSLGGKNSSPAPPTPRVHIEPAEMEAKKILLPYLDRLDYIDVQLSRRQLGSETMGIGLAATHTTKGLQVSHEEEDRKCAISPTFSDRSQRSHASSHRTHPEVDSRSTSHAGTPRHSLHSSTSHPSSPTASDDMYFRAPTPSPRAKRQKPTDFLNTHNPTAERNVNISPIKTGTLRGPPATHGTGAHATSLISTLAPPVASLCSRYYRTTLLAELQLPAKQATTLHRSCPAHAYTRSIPWLLKLIETVYDAAWTLEESTATKPGGVHVSMKERERKAMMKTTFLTVEGENITNDIIVPGAGVGGAPPPSDDDAAHFGVTMPTILMDVLNRMLGSQDIVKQTLVDLLALTELNRATPEIELFSLFLRELYDEDCFVFFLMCRSIVTKRLGLNLANLRDRVFPDTVANLNLKEGAVMTRAHRTIADGTKDAFMNKDQASYLIRQVVPPSSPDSTDLNGESVLKIRNHVMWTLELKDIFKTFPGPTHILADGTPQTFTYPMGNIFLILKSLVDDFAKTSEKIVKELKYNDDGNRLTMLEMLQETVADDEKLKDAQAKVNNAENKLLAHNLEVKKETFLVDQQTRRLVDAQLQKDSEEEMKLETSVGSSKTQLFLMKNHTVKLTQDLQICNNELQAIEDHHNNVWVDIITNEQKGKSKKAKFNAIKKRYPHLSKGCNQGLLRFGMHLVQKYEAHQVTLKAARMFSGDWKASLEEIREELVKVLQRAYRKRREARIAQRAAQGELNARRAIRKAAAEEELKKQEAERRRTQAQAERQMARVREIMRKRRIDEVRQKTREDIIKQQAAWAEADRRLWTINRRFIKTVWKNWALQIIISKNKINKYKFFLTKIIKNWGALAALTGAKKKSAMLLQRIYRGRLEYRKVLEMKAKFGKSKGIVRGAMVRLRYRGMANAFDGWKIYWDRSKRITKLRSGALGRGVAHRFDMWKLFLVVMAEIKYAAADVVINFGRSVLAKTFCARVKRERLAASLIQRLWRGRQGMLDFQNEQQREWNNQMTCMRFLAKQRLKAKKETFYRIFVNPVRIKKGVMRVNWGLMKMVFKHGIKKYAHFSRLEKDKLYKLKTEKATFIQSWWQGYLGRQRFLGAVRLKKKCIFLQSCVRRNLALTRIYFIRMNHAAAIELQCGWRVYASKCVLHAIKVADFLKAADNNNYDRMLENWCGEETDDDGNNALHRAAIAGAKRCVKLCVAEGFDPNVYNNHGKTALHLCIETTRLGRDETVEWLLDHKAEIEAPDYDGYTPLLLACKLGRGLITRYLCERDADVHAMDYNGHTPLQLSIMHDVDGDHEGCVVQLLMHAADPNQVGDDGCVPLHDITAHGDGGVTVMKHLLAYDADLTKQDDHGFTPFMYAVNQNLVGMCNVMMEFHADCEAKDNEGRTALHIAASSNSPDVVPIICEGNCMLEEKDGDGDTALHIAVSLDHWEVVKALLQEGTNASVQNELGDQPAHVAARLGRLQCMHKMLEYDSHMGRRNWAELTPIGVARMHSQMEIVALLKENFSPEQLGEVGDDDDVDVNAWDDEIMEEVEDWEEAWDDENQVSYWISNTTGETRDSAHPPEMEVRKIMDARAAGERHMTRRVQVMKGEGDLGTAQYNQHHQAEWDEIEQMRLEWRSSILIQKCWRMKSAILEKLQLRLERKSSNIIQRAGTSWRWRFHDKHYLELQRAARKIQTYERMRFLEHCYKAWQRERLWWYRAERICALFGQRLWRGYIGRRSCRRSIEVRDQPHPDDKKNFDHWFKLQKEAFPPNRSFQIFDEYTLKGCPRSWEERAFKKQAMWGKAEEGGVAIECFRDVRFYVNRITDQAQWWIPDEWDADDRRMFVLREQTRKQGFTIEEYNAATCMQALWNKRQCRRNFRMMLEAKRMGEAAEKTYLEDPDNIVALCNYTVYLHVVLQAYERARKLYRFMMEFMQERGPDNAFVLYSVAIFGAVTLEEDWNYIKDWAWRAKKADAFVSKRQGKAATAYNLADAGFFKTKALFDQTGESWHNYALCRMLVYHDLEGARDAFIRAVSASPHDKRIAKNFNVLIQDVDYYGREKPWDCFDEYMAHQRGLVEEQWEEEAEARKEAEEAEHMQHAATKLCRWWRHMKDAGARAELAKAGLSALLKIQLIKETRGGNFDDDSQLSLFTEVTWEECVNDQGKLFWYNTITGNSVWVKPEEGTIVQGEDSSQISSLEGIGNDDMSIATMEQEPEMGQLGESRWETCFDEDGKRFFFDTITEESQWHTPREEGEGQIVEYDEEKEEELPEWEQCEDEETGAKYWYNTITGKSGWETPRELTTELVLAGEKDEWEECEDDEGDVFFYNALSGESQWHAPGEEPPKEEVWRPECYPLPRGRLILQCVRARNVKGKDATLKAYMKLKLGESIDKKDKNKPVKTKTADPAQSGGAIAFRNEQFTFDLQDPVTKCNKDGNMLLYVELYDDNFFKDPILCTGTLDMTDFVACPWWFGDVPKMRTVQLYKLGTTEKNGTVDFNVEFWKAEVGCLRVVLESGKQLANKGGMTDTQDPYVKIELDKQVAKSKTHSNGGVNPKFNNEELLIYVGHDDWTKDLKISVWDDDTISDDLIGQGVVDLLKMMAHNGYKKKDNPILELLDKKGKKKCGALLGKIEFLPVGRLNIMVHYGKNLRNPDYLGKPDPYLVLELDQGIPIEYKTMPSDELENKKSRKIKAIEKDKKSAIGAARKLMFSKKQTKVVNGTLNPEWFAEISFDVIDAEMLKITCFDEDVGKDDLIGSCEISLLEVFEMGHVDKEYSLTYKTKKSDKPAGDIKLSFNFWGPPTVKYPQRKVPGAQYKSYGDRRRRGAGYTPAALNASAMLDLAGGAEKMQRYLTMPGALETPGILKVRVIEAQNIKSKDSRLNSYCYLRLGKNKARHRPTKRTKTVKCKQSSLANSKWDEEVELVVEDMESLVEDDDVVLTVDIYDDNIMLDTLLGSCDIKLKNLFLACSGVERVDMYSFVPAGGGQVKLGITWWKMARGAVLFTLVEGKELKVPSMFKSGKGMDPYVYIECGKAKARGRTISNGGKDPVFGSEELLVYCDDDSWKKDGVMTVFDDDVGRDAVIGKTQYNLLDIMTPEDKNDADAEGKVIEGELKKSLKKSSGVTGELRYGMRFLPAAKLIVKAVSGRNLRNPGGRGKPDPYIELTLEDSQMEEGVQKKKTPSHNNGGCDPQWNYDVEFEILDQYELTVRCFDKDLLSKDDLIGTSTVSLLKLFREGAANAVAGSASQDVWVPLSFMAGSKKGSVPAGDVHLIMYFASPLGVEYPLYRPSITGDTAAMDGEDAAGGIKHAGDVLSVPPVDSLKRLVGKPKATEEYVMGRLMVTVHEGRDILGEDKSLQCYCVFKLGGAKATGEYKKKTATTPKVDDGCPKFTEEKLYYDLKDVGKFLKNLKKNDDNGDIYDDLELEVTVYDDNYLKDKAIARLSLDVKELFFRPSRMWTQYFDLSDERAQKKKKKKGEEGGEGDEGSSGGNGQLKLSLQFLACYTGVIKCTLIEARDLPNASSMGKQDPYVRLVLPGGKKKEVARGKTVEDGGVDCSFGREQLLLWCDGSSCFDGLDIEIWDDDVGRDDFIGKLNVGVFEYAALSLFSGGASSMRSYDLVKNGKPGGTVIAVVEFLPAADLVVTCLRGKDLRNPNWMGTADPYVYLESESLVATSGDWKVRSKTVSKGGKVPDWGGVDCKGKSREEGGGEVLDAVKIVDHDQVIVTVYDDDVGRDDVIGRITLSMSDILGRGVKERWLKLRTSKDKPAGDVLLSFDCRLPLGCMEGSKNKLAWPYCRPSAKPVVVGLLKDTAGDVEEEEESTNADNKGGKELSVNDLWEEQQDEEGNVYYFNTITEEASWTMPEGYIDLDTGGAVNVLGLPHVNNRDELLAVPSVLSEIGRGRLDVVVKEGNNVVGNDSCLQCYAVVKLGSGGKKGDFYSRGKTSMKCENGKPVFGGGRQEINFRDLNKVRMVLGVKKDVAMWEIDSTVVKVEVWDDNYLKDVKLGTASIDVKELLLRPGTPWEQWFDLDGEKGGRVLVNLQFLSVYEGFVRMELREGVGLVNPDMVGAPDPYVILEMKDGNGKGKRTAKSKVVDGGGVDPKFGSYASDGSGEGETLMMWCTEDMMWDGLKIDVWDDDVGRDDHMGMLKLDLFQYACLTTVNEDIIKERMFPLRTKGGKPAGELKGVFDFYVTVELEVTVKEGRNLYNPNLMGKSDPYVLLECESLMEGGGKKGRTKADNGGGKAPKWGGDKKKGGEDNWAGMGEKIMMKLCDHAEMKLSVFDDDVGKDDLIGTADLSLKELYEWSVVDRDKWAEQEMMRKEAVARDGHGDDVKVGRWLPIVTKKGKKAGEILVELKCNLVMGGNRNGGARTLDYPQGRTGIEGLCLWELEERYAWEFIEVEGYYLNSFSGASVWEKPGNMFDKDEVRRKKEMEKKALEEHGELDKLVARERRESKMGGDGEMDDDDLNNELRNIQPVIFKKDPVDTYEELLATPQKLAAFNEGRIEVQCHECKKVKGADKSLQVYVVMKLCKKGKGKFKHKTKTTGVVTNGHPKWETEKAVFDLKDMEKVIQLIADSGDKSLMLNVDVFDDNYMKDVCIGSCEVDLKELLMRPSTPWKEYFSLDKGGGRVGLTLNYFMCYNGVVRVTLSELSNMTNPDAVGMPDPYVLMSVKSGGKKRTQRTKTYNDGGLDLDLGREVFTFWCDEGSMFEGVKVDVWDDDVGRDDLMASCTLDLFQYSAASTEVWESPKDLVYYLRKGGELVVCCEFVPVVNLQVVVCEGRDLRNPNMMGKTFDPYLLFESKSRAGVGTAAKDKVKEKGGIGNLKLRSKTDSDGSKVPNWGEEELYGMLCDHKVLVISAFDDDVGKDDFIGKCEVDLCELYKEGSLDRWWELKSKNGKKKCGEVRVKFNVKAQRGVSGEVERKVGYPSGWDLRGVGGVEEDVVVGLTVKGYGVKGRVYDKPVPVGRRLARAETGCV